jgi:cell division protein FtsB
MENFIDKDTQIELLKTELEKVKQENTDLKTRLDKYTNNYKKYYEKNKETILKRNNDNYHKNKN